MANHRFYSSLVRASAVVLALLASGNAGYAVPARQGIVSLEQPDGSVIEACIRGDEYHHFVTTPDGRPLKRDANGFYIVADGDAGEFFKSMSEKSERSPRRRFLQKKLARQAKSRAAGSNGYGLFPGTSFPSAGSPRALVVLVEYSDVKFKVADAHDYFSRMINQEGFSDYGGTGSVMDFFIDNSEGKFTPVFDVYGPITLSGTQKYYGENKSDGDDVRPHMMAVEACRQLDATVDFSVYDNDGDGVIDNVFVFFAGEAESSTYVADQVWPHTGFVSYSSSVPVMFDGVGLDRYACSNEWTMPRPDEQPGPGRPDGIGTFVHEFSHVMGLPDLYSTKYNKAFTPGTWSTLDYGPYNNDGCTPPNYSVFERYALGWLKPRVITSAANVRLESISHNQAAMIPTPKPTEFFLFENRQQQGWDKYIPGHGMLVWHIDYNEDIWAMNAVNNTVSHQYVDIEEADGMSTEDTRADDAFPSSLGRTEFNDNTIPSMMPWTGRSIGLPVSAITEHEDGVITFKVAGGRPDITIPVAHEAAEVTPGGFLASWTPSDEPGCTYTLSVYAREDNSGEISYVRGYNHLDVGDVTSHRVTGLASGTRYFYTVAAVVASGESEPSNEIEVTTLPPTFDYLSPAEPVVGDVWDTGFALSWDDMPGADEYFIHLSTPMPDGHLKIEFDFTGGLNALPEGWGTTANSTYAMASNAGVSAPSLRFTKEGQWIETAKTVDDIVRVGLWCRGVGTAAGDALEVYGLDKDGTPALLSTINLSTVAGGSIESVGPVPAGIRAIRIESRHTKGSAAIDDIVAEYGTAYSDMPVTGFENYSTGISSACRLEDLAPDTQYNLYLTARSGEMESRPSPSISVRTLLAGGISDAKDAACTVEVNGRTVILHGRDAGFKVYDIYGRVVAVGDTDGSMACATVPCAGIYIVKTIEKAFPAIYIK